MKKAMIRITMILLAAFGSCAATYCATGAAAMRSVVITLGVTLYHFAMRLLVGTVCDRLMRNRADYTKKWFRVSGAEMRFYTALRVKKWKKHMPTYERAYFDMKQRSLKEIVGATCQAEVVHEVIVVLSFAPIALGRWFGSGAVFAATSAAAALVDASFVVMQRFNRHRLMKMIER